MEIGIDSFAALQNRENTATNRQTVVSELLERIKLADQVGLDIFGIGEHHRADFLDAANSLLLSAAAATTTNIKLTSAVTVLSAADPVRVYQQYATLDLISKGRAEIVVGRGSFTESFPLFGYHTKDYNALFIEKLRLLIKINNQNSVTWSGKFRPALIDQEVHPCPYQKKLPIWVGVGGTPASFVRAGKLGLPLMIAIIGGETHRFRPLVDLYRKAGLEAGFKKEVLKVGIHSLGFVADTDEAASEIYFPGYKKMFNKIGRERGWPPINRAQFNDSISPLGALVVGSPSTVAKKIQQHSEALGGIDRFTFQMDNDLLTHEALSKAIKLIGQQVIPKLKEF